MDDRNPSVWALFCCLSRDLSSWIGSKATRMWTEILIKECPCCMRQFNSLYQSANLNWLNTWLNLKMRKLLLCYSHIYHFRHSLFLHTVVRNPFSAKNHLDVYNITRRPCSYQLKKWACYRFWMLSLAYSCLGKARPNEFMGCIWPCVVYTWLAINSHLAGVFLSLKNFVPHLL